MDGVRLSARVAVAYVEAMIASAEEFRELVRPGERIPDERLRVRPDGGAWIAVECRCVSFVFDVPPGHWSSRWTT
jgi:hypothetical protein